MQAQLELFAADAAATSPAPDTRWRALATPYGCIRFRLRRSRRRSIGLTVDAQGLIVTAPQWLSVAQTEAAIQAKARWIVRKLAQHRQRQCMPESAWRHQGSVPYFGQKIRLILVPDADSLRFDGDVFAPQTGNTLVLPLPLQAETTRVRDTAHAWLQQQARAWFAQRLQFFLQQTQQRIPRWGLSSATTRWGSCSSDGSIRLNWRLIHLPHDLIDYVVVHEISHLREMNHSHAFWREVGQLLPGFETARQALKQVDLGRF